MNADNRDMAVASPRALPYQHGAAGVVDVPEPQADQLGPAMAVE